MKEMDTEMLAVNNVDAETGKEETKEINKLYVEFKKPYRFEGQDYEGIDLSGLKKLRIKDAVEIQKELFNKQEEATMLIIETSSAFPRALAAKATKKPIEFFEYMKRGTAGQVLPKVMAYMNVDVVEDENRPHVMIFEEPYAFNGEIYDGIDLSMIGELNSLQESAIENKMAAAGVYAQLNRANYYYVCLTASAATGKPENFFLELPIIELLKLKTMVNDPGFLE